ncbi:MAG: lysostaphin resistance A-like protein [Actinomycetota bacterium]
MVKPANELQIPHRTWRAWESPTAAARPEAAASLRSVIVFLICTFTLSWLAFLPLILERVDPDSAAGAVLLPLIGIGAPTITAFVLVALGSGRAGAGRLWRSGLGWRTGLRWYAVVVFLPGIAFGASWAVASGLEMDTSLFNPLIPALIAGLLAGMLEEFGWSGFAWPRLQAHYGFMWAGIAMGFIVALWHLPLFFTPGQPQSEFSFVPFLLTLIAVRILFGWVYNAAGWSVLLTVLLHASGNTWSEILPLDPVSVNAAWLTEFLVFGIVALIVVLKYRGSDGALTSSNVEVRHG